MSIGSQLTGGTKQGSKKLSVIDLIPTLQYFDTTLTWSQAVVVYVESEDDVSACLRWVKKWGLDVAIAGGRHTFHQASSTDGLVIGRRTLMFWNGIRKRFRLNIS
jgi:FAD binding domain